jgi:hypothetical protein
MFMGYIIMPRKPLSRKELAEIFTDLHKHGIAELQIGKDITEEEVMGAFGDIAAMGYEHIHTLRVVPDDGREPYYVHRNNLVRT